MYKLKAPNDIDTVEIIVPIHFPKNKPDKISKGEPNPSKTIQIIEKIENRKRFITKFFPIISSKFI